MSPAVVVDSSTSAVNTPRDQSRTAVSRYLKDKEEEWNKVADRNRPLTLLELPVDILRLIITHTNDLTSLALTNSTLHNLAVPHIYARFDIVWPDGHVVVNDSKSVDALTYGLSTLCLGTSFARTTRRLRNPNAPPLAKFKGNEYAKYTRKFSLGNGPTDWVAEYLITKEPGKMLGTLVALAVAKMQSLETFTWDMPTGVLSDIFMSLASLPEYYDNNNCKLEKVWIRWHDNNENAATVTPPSTVLAPAATSASVPSGSTLTPIGILLPDNTPHPIPRRPVSYADHHVEYPTLSVLPPLKSLTVLEIDELAYLDEMADLIARSVDRLQELRVGISAKTMHKDFAQSWDGSAMQQVDNNARWPGESTIGERRLGGVLGVLVGKIYDIRRRSPPTKSKEKLPTPTDPPETNHTSDLATSVGGGMSIPNRRKRLDGKLTLQTLELERVALSLHVCRYAIDWTVLTSITILDCPQHDALWKMLKKQYQPAPITSGWGVKQTTSNPPLQYQLPLKRIHTDGVTASLISFIKETLAPNSLEDLFLQDRKRGVVPAHSGAVTIEQIFKGAIKRHRSSLRKLLIDSSSRTNISGAISNEHPSNRWKCWVLPPEVVAYITSGRMSNLRELAVALDYKDWHAFLQRLPNLPQLRSLNIPNIANHVQQTFDPKELAMQIADVITLRPEIQLCYVGIYTKCFEILETRDDKSTGSGSNSTSGGNEGATNGTSVHGNDATDASTGSTAEGDGTVDLTTSEDDDDDDDDDGDDGEEVTDDDDEGDNDGAASSSPIDPDETQSEGFGGDDSDDDSFVEDPAFRTKLRLREILFYDDKVAIFKARHGKL
ncbi:F-box domain-containing protein [Coniochaeta sp. 2T2.1]|nr:F-box domain-containing protein [Coniochaeta sp. 2T2.1]